MLNNKSAMVEFTAQDRGDVVERGEFCAVLFETIGITQQSGLRSIDEDRSGVHRHIEKGDVRQYMTEGSLWSRDRGIAERERNELPLVKGQGTTHCKKVTQG